VKQVVLYKKTILLDLCFVFIWIINTLFRNEHLDDVTEDYLSFDVNINQGIIN